MPYSDSWADLKNISGAVTPANQIDDKFRLRGLGIEERMNDALVVDWSADPVVVKDSILGKVVGKVLLIPHNMFTERVSVGSITSDRGQGFTHLVPEDGVVDAPVVLPPGVTITLVEILVRLDASTTITWEFFSFDFTTSTPGKTSIIGPNVFNTVGFQMIGSGVQNITVDGQHTYYLSIDVTSVGGGCDVYGVRITYDTPSSQQTI